MSVKFRGMQARPSRLDAGTDLDLRTLQEHREERKAFPNLLSLELQHKHSK